MISILVSILFATPVASAITDVSPECVKSSQFQDKSFKDFKKKIYTSWISDKAGKSCPHPGQPYLAVIHSRANSWVLDAPDGPSTMKGKRFSKNLTGSEPTKVFYLYPVREGQAIGCLKWVLPATLSDCDKSQWARTKKKYPKLKL